MRSLLVAALFFVLTASADCGLRHCVFRVHVEGNANDSAVFAQPIPSMTGRDVFMQVDRRVSDGQIYIPSGLTEADIKLMSKDWKPRGGRIRK